MDFDHLFSDGPSLPTADTPAGVVTVPAAPAGELAMGPFEASDRLDSSIALWSSPLRSIDADVLPEKPVIDGRARDMMRNDAYVQGGSTLHKDNIVGSHYLLNSRPSSKIIFGKQDDLWEEEFQEEVEEKWDLYSDSTDGWIDATRTNNFTQLVRLGVGIRLMAGEFLATVEWIKDDGAPFNTAIQFVDLDRLSTDPLSLSRGDQNVRAGIRFNNRGAPIAYQIRTEHPADYGNMYTRNFQMPQWKEISRKKPWGRLQVIHLFETLRPDQSRGVTEMAASLKAMKMSHTWRDINIQHAVTQALYAAAITSDLPSEQVFASLGGGALTADKAQELVTNYAEGYLSSIAQYAGTNRGLQIDGVKIPHLYPGTKLELLSPGKSGLQPEFEQSLLRYIAASLGVSYEQLSRDYTHTNYASARAAMAETWKFMQSQKKMFADRFASICYRLWLEEAINKGEITSFPKNRAARLYTNGVLNMKFDAISKCDWIGASRGQIDEYKETQAAVLRITNGLSTAEDELARLGKDWRKVYRQLKREMALRETLGLMFSGTDPAVLAANSNAMATDTQNQGNANGN